MGRSNGSMLECTEVRPFLKNVNFHTFNDFNFNALASKLINNGSEELIIFNFKLYLIKNRNFELTEAKVVIIETTLYIIINIIVSVPNMSFKIPSLG